MLEKAFCEGYEYAQKEFASYKPPFNEYETRKMIKQMNKFGLKGKNIDQIASNNMKRIKKMYPNKEQAQKALRDLHDGLMTSEIAERLNKGKIKGIKKGII